ncbi:hypothetical protein B0181_01025 [Moraxella caviae]|uniref:Uncharacterized protein n=1 Tax=Moraxella caviae TaxID=34060 RepID=A0A1T0AB62_9GAMM|nr:hypothetical protein B0181_01025 [Moraxella caviae]
MDIALAFVGETDDGAGVQFYEEMQVAAGSSIYQALQESGWLLRAELADFAKWCADNACATPNHRAWFVGIYSEKRSLTDVLAQGDRIEIYRALSSEPMQRRKRRSKPTVRKLGARS